MLTRFKSQAGAIAVMMTGLMVLAGCATFGKARVIEPGDKIQVNLTCRLKDGSVIYTTRKDPDILKEKNARLYFERKDDGPMDVVAGSGYTAPFEGKLKSFTGEVMACVSRAVVGMQVGDRKQISLESAVPDGLTDSDRYLTIVKIKKNPLLRETTRTIFLKEMGGKEPVPGYEIKNAGPFTLTVKSVDKAKDKVVIAISFKDGDKLDMAYGPAILRHDGDQYELNIDAREGYLVRTSGLLGRISNVGTDKFVVDYGHPFGGETLVCGLDVVGIGTAKHEAVK